MRHASGERDHRSLKARSFVLVVQGALALGWCPALARAAETGDGAAAEQAVEPLATTAPMRDWAAAQTRGRRSPRARLAALRDALVAGGWRERDDLTLTAAEAFGRREGDCVSFALLLVALARSQGAGAYFSLAGPGSSTSGGGFEIARGHLAAGFGPPADSTLYDAGGARAAPAGFRPIPDASAIAIYHSNRGAALLLQGEWRRAAAALETATAADAGLPAAWSNLGVARGRLGDLAGAEAAYRRSIALAPDSPFGWRNLALLLERRLGACGAEPLARLQPPPTVPRGRVE